MPDIPTFAPRLQRGVASVLDTATSIVLDQRKRLYDAEVQHQFSRGVYEMDKRFNEFMVDAANRQDYMKMDEDWDKFQKETYSDITSRFTLPEASAEFEKAYLNDEPRRRFQVAQQARAKQIKATIADDARSLDFYVKTSNWEGTKRQIEAMRATGIYSDADMSKIEDDAHQKVTTNGYLGYADIIARQNPTEDGVMAASIWLLDNTPEWSKDERESHVSTFRQEWAIRLAGMKGQRDGQNLKEWSSANDELLAYKNNEVVPSVTMTSLHEKYPSLSASQLSTLHNGYLDHAEAVKEEGRLNNYFDLSRAVEGAVENGQWDAAASAAQAKFLKPKERDTLLDLIAKAKADEGFAADYVSASKVVTGFREGKIADVDPNQFYSKTLYPKLDEKAREHFANEINAEKDRRKTRSDDPFTTSDPGLDVYAYNMMRDKNFSLAAKLEFIRKNTGPGPDGARRLSKSAAENHEAAARRFSPDSANDTSRAILNDYYKDEIAEEKDSDKRDILRLNQLSDLQRLEGEITKSGGRPEEAAGNIVKFRRQEVGRRNIKRVLEQWEGSTLGVERFFTAGPERTPADVVPPPPSAGPVTGRTRDGRIWHLEVRDGREIWVHRPTGETKPK